MKGPHSRRKVPTLGLLLTMQVSMDELRSYISKTMGLNEEDIEGYVANLQQCWELLEALGSMAAKLRNLGGMA
jgi:hypothetical protein